MFTGIKQQATVKPGGIIELTSPDLQEGTTVEVIVLIQTEPGQANSPEGASQPARSLAQFIGAAPGNFATPEEADHFIRQERDA
ncbi:MAG: hypothetical protein ACO4AI_03965 [Prochlorothrix sp.]